MHKSPEVRLRLYASRSNLKGSPDMREHCIDTFLAEVRCHVSDAILTALPDAQLEVLFADWLKAASGGVSQEEREQRFSQSAWMPPLAPFSRGPAEPGTSDAENVVSLHERTGR